ncbi:8872_t:CDS:2 [Ambispora gerdemannii]|uniref:8872_t:CDS:1 n=1 Tax=Ambispora gerdemannii TaxID=144530 RepID=A0A9N8YSF6_9GLOM|nr:8872_t:CDS:2 [Ambispora gerdemannii]
MVRPPKYDHTFRASYYYSPFLQVESSLTIWLEPSRLSPKRTQRLTPSMRNRCYHFQCTLRTVRKALTRLYNTLELGMFTVLCQMEKERLIKSMYWLLGVLTRIKGVRELLEHRY